jgi:hypothetical protein
MDQVIEDLRRDLLSWTNGSKKVFVHSSAHMAVVQLVEELNSDLIEVMIGTFNDNLAYIKDYVGLSTLFIVGDKNEMDMAKYVTQRAGLRCYQI